MDLGNECDEGEMNNLGLPLPKFKYSGRLIFQGVDGALDSTA